MAYLAERYAHLLSKEDILELFHDLEEACGSLSEACRKCGIQRKTRYDWIDARSLKLSTKKKVLKALMEIEPEKTLDFLLARSKEITVELLSMNLSNTYAKAMAEGISPESFINTIQKFEETKNKHTGLIRELEEELGDMTHFIRERASTLNISLPAESIDTVRPSHMLEMIPIVVDAISRRGFRSFSELATDLNVPEKLVQVMSEVIKIPICGVLPPVTTHGEPFDQRIWVFIPGMSRSGTYRELAKILWHAKGIDLSARVDANKSGVTLPSEVETIESRLPSRI